MKRIIWLLAWVFSLWCVGTISQADFSIDDYSKKFYNEWDDSTQGEATIDRWKAFKDQAENSGMRDKLLKFLGIEDLKAEWGVGFIKWILNALLAFAGLIALCFMIYGFLRIFFASGDEALKNAWTIVRISAIALVIIATAWFIESMFFYVYEKISGPL